MKSTDIPKTVAQVEQLLDKEKGLSPVLESAIRMLILVVKLLLDSKGLNSKNSSKPPSSDPNREKKPRRKSIRKAGGQPGHIGTTLQQVEDPDEVLDIEIDRRTLPKGSYKVVGHEKRQVVDIQISRYVTEYRAQILEDEHGNRFVARFPEGVKRPAQYGNDLKTNAVYMSMYQLIPYERVQSHFAEMFETPVSTGSLANFNLEAYQRLEPFAVLAPEVLHRANCLHADETGVNINGKRKWLHVASNDYWTWIEPHEKRGMDAMEEIGILPEYRGLLVHDHWKPYLKLKDCLHVLCNAHHARELVRAYEQDGQKWAKAMEDLLYEMNDAVKEAGGVLKERDQEKWLVKYRKVIEQGEKECPHPEPEAQKTRGRQARSKARNLLERLRDYEDEVLRFMREKEAPFTNNLGERDLRMSKVQQKISGCFRSWEGARVYCRVRSYLSTCQKHGVSIGEALSLLFEGKWPEFIQEKLAELEK